MRLKYNFFAFFLIILVVTSLAFLAKIIWDITRQPILYSYSSIPNLSVNKLNSLAEKTKKKTRISSGQIIDYSQIQYGNQEPFKQ